MYYIIIHFYMDKNDKKQTICNKNKELYSNFVLFKKIYYMEKNPITIYNDNIKIYCIFFN